MWKEWKKSRHFEQNTEHWERARWPRGQMRERMDHVLMRAWHPGADVPQRGPTWTTGDYSTSKQVMRICHHNSLQTLQALFCASTPPLWASSAFLAPVPICRSGSSFSGFGSATKINADACGSGSATQIYSYGVYLRISYLWAIQIDVRPLVASFRAFMMEFSVILNEEIYHMAK
jgi:hypothetical protein